MRARGWLWRGGLLLLAFVAALVAFRAGAVVSDRDLAGAPLHVHVYYALGLFVLGGLDLGTPTGGPLWAQRVLWLSYFAAPLITTGAVAEGVVRLLRPDWWLRWRMRDHLVVVGAGRLGLLFLEGLPRDRRRPIVVVDQERPESLAAELRERLGVLWIRGDVRKPATLLALALGRARGVVLLTGDDLVNLEAASAIRDAHPKLPVVAHVADLGLRRRLAELGEEDGTFNAHRLAARHLFGTGLAERLRETAEKDVLVLVGFGRFGQTILEELRTHREIADELRAVVVVDRQAEKLLRFFTDEVGEAHPPVRAVDGDVADPDTWRRVSEALSGLEATAPPFYVLGTDDDALNLRVAMALRREGEVGEGELVAVRGAHCHIVARVFAPSSFTRALGERFDFRVLPIAELLRAAVRERAGRWFRRR